MSGLTSPRWRVLGATRVAGADGVRLHDRPAPLPRPPRPVYVTHGEPQAADALRQAIEERFGWEASVPDYLDTV